MSHRTEDAFLNLRQRLKARGVGDFSFVTRRGLEIKEAYEHRGKSSKRVLRLKIIVRKAVYACSFEENVSIPFLKAFLLFWVDEKISKRQRFKRRKKTKKEKKGSAIKSRDERLAR